MATTKDLAYLGRIMPKYADALVKDVIALQNDIALATVAALAKDTPVDRGTARSNWQVGIDTAPQGTRAAFSPFNSRWRAPRGAGGTKGETQNQAGAVWAATGVLKGRTAPNPVYIANNLPYIEPLNDGHSPQSSSGWVQRAIIKGRADARARFQFKNIESVK